MALVGLPGFPRQFLWPRRGRIHSHQLEQATALARSGASQSSFCAPSPDGLMARASPTAGEARVDSFVGVPSLPGGRGQHVTGHSGLSGRSRKPGVLPPETTQMGHFPLPTRHPEPPPPPPRPPAGCPGDRRPSAHRSRPPGSAASRTSPARRPRPASPSN